MWKSRRGLHAWSSDECQRRIGYTVSGGCHVTDKLEGNAYCLRFAMSKLVTTVGLRKQCRNRFRLNKFAWLVEMVSHDRVWSDSEALVNCREQLARMDRVF